MVGHHKKLGEVESFGILASNTPDFFTGINIVAIYFVLQYMEYSIIRRLKTQRTALSKLGSLAILRQPVLPFLGRNSCFIWM
jgi:hypothetical protein